MTLTDRLKSSFDALISPKTLDEQLEDLARARQSLTEYKEALAGLVEEFEAELYVIEAQQRIQRASATVAQLESDVHELTIARFRRDGIKKPKGAASWVRETSALEYDPEVALDYSRDHLPQALKLDRGAFNKAAKVLDLEFVEVGTEIKASISRNLDHLIPEAAVEEDVTAG